MSINLAHFVYHNSEIPLYAGEGSWEGRRLVAFGQGTLTTTGACGYAHAIDLYVRPGRKILPHWHDDREAVYYCISGRGRFLLDEIARDVGPGDAMFQPLYAVHGADNPTGEDLRFVDVALFTRTPSPVLPGEECFTSASRAPTSEHRGATLKSLFPPSYYGNPRIEWCGELHVDAGRTLDPYAYPRSEQILLVLEGSGSITIEGVVAQIRPGSVLYIPAGFTHSLTAEVPVRIFGARSQTGRVETPRMLRRRGAGECDAR